MNDLHSYACDILAARIDRAGDDNRAVVMNAPDDADFVGVCFKIVTLESSHGVTYDRLMIWTDETPPNAPQCIEFLPHLIEQPAMERLVIGGTVTLRPIWRGDGWELVHG